MDGRGGSPTREAWIQPIANVERTPTRWYVFLLVLALALAVVLLLVLVRMRIPVIVLARVRVRVLVFILELVLVLVVVMLTLLWMLAPLWMHCIAFTRRLLENGFLAGGVSCQQGRASLREDCGTVRQLGLVANRCCKHAPTGQVGDVAVLHGEARTSQTRPKSRMVRPTTTEGSPCMPRRHTLQLTCETQSNCLSLASVTTTAVPRVSRCAA